MRKLLLAFLLPLCAASWSAVAAAADKTAAPPADAAFTIYCQSFTGPVRADQSKQVRDSLIKSTGMNDWYLVHIEQESTLYYGFYRSKFIDAQDADDRKDAQRAQADLKTIKAIENDDKKKMFPVCFFELIARPGGEGPPEWNVLNTDKTAFWSLLIGVYRDHPDRKKAAVEAVKVLRDSGVIAYYLHADTSSMVCIGAWTEDAIKKQQTDNASVDNDPNVEIVVVNAPLPKNAPREYLSPEGKKIRVFAPEIEVLNPELQQMMDRYPYFHTNGEVMGRKVRDPKTQKESILRDHSTLLIIPRRKPTMLDGGSPAGKPPAEVELLTRPSATPPPGSSKLKKLED